MTEHETDLKKALERLGDAILKVWEKVKNIILKAINKIYNTIKDMQEQEEAEKQRFLYIQRYGYKRGFINGKIKSRR